MSAILTCRGLKKGYGAARGLDGVDLELESGHIVGLLGPNGSGKTTLIKLANGLLTPSGGEILIAGQKPGPETRAIVSYLPDADYLPDWMSLRDLTKLFRDFFADFDPERSGRMFEALGLHEDDRLRALSKGNREKTQLVLTMSRKAALYLLDEPIGGVDPAARDYILRTIIGNCGEQSTVLLSTHLIADVESVLDEVVFLKDGKAVLHENADSLREREGKSVDSVFREVFACGGN
ncbi:MAG: ABC transporter ATP-binding protein [Oscillospiraceae bacterium]|nr:ABC transporter ATP-binding protein [Oscillospiraceae bacterium]